ncbi:predicted protein [Thalassiosira pseudonana CCMP1335]|uniref:HSF-type DNA-binding domain-containing protein n=1 Tax=Thalassiosira pseudonana TaxID=35128 RepID=B8CF56_THAPS|nr:predicted protein [Thalassiosira pseudonana CCMP1335]EED88021.1 predicted protein [Thalassiosira pseudonana CCMP1335]
MGFPEPPLTWLHHGRAFFIKNADVFGGRSCRGFGRLQRFEALRGNSVCGVTKDESGRDSESWYHPHFLRGCPEEARQNVIRTSIKGNINDKMKEEDDGGNFYEMEPIVPEAEAVPMMISSSS